MLLNRSMSRLTSRAACASSNETASLPSPISVKASFMRLSGRNTKNVVTAYTTAPMSSVMNRKYTTSRTTLSRTACCCWSRGITMLMAPPTESRVQPSFTLPRDVDLARRLAVAFEAALVHLERLRVTEPLDAFEVGRLP